MPVGFTEDQEQFRDVVARFLGDKSPPTAVRKLMADAKGYDADVWRQLAQDLGLLGTHLPERYGGFGFGPVEQGIIAQEMGRFLFCGPYFASAVMAGYAVLNAADDAQRSRLLGDIATGARIATLVLDDLAEPAGVGRSLRAERGTISGVADKVVDAQVADVLIVAAASAAGVSLYEVEPGHAQH